MTAAALCAALLLTATGCGQEQEAAAFEPKLDTEQKVVLNTSGFFGNFEALDQVIADFNQYYPNVEFNYEQNGIDNFESYINANPNVDIMMTSEEIFEKLGDTVDSICADLSKEDIDLSNIDEKMLSRGYHNGKLTRIPMGQSTYGLVVNVSLLEKEGLEVPTNYEELTETLKTLKEKGYTPIQGPESKVYAELTHNMVFDTILSDKELCSSLAQGNGDESAAEKIAPAFERITDMVSGGFIDASVNETYPDDNYDQAILNFFEGDVPFWVCNTEKVSGMKKRESKSEAFQKDPFEYTFIYAPLGEKGVYAYSEPWFGFSVNKNAENYDYAVEFIRFLAQKNELDAMAAIKGVPSVTVGGSEQEIYKNIQHPENTEMECVNEGGATAAMVTAWYTCASKYAAGEYASPEEAAADFGSMCAAK